MNRKQIAAIVLSITGMTGVAIHEGYRENAYIPVKGDVPTIGYGNTTYLNNEKVKLGDTITRKDANELLSRKLKLFENGVKSCVKVPLHQYEYDAYVSLSYNIGVNAFCSSTLVKILNNQDYRAACSQILRWDKFKGVRLQGLTNRRQDEYKQCVGTK